MHHRSHDQTGGLCPGGSLSKGSLSRGVSVHGGSLSREVSVRETPLDRDPPDGYEWAVGILMECILVLNFLFPCPVEFRSIQCI